MTSCLALAPAAIARAALTVLPSLPCALYLQMNCEPQQTLLFSKVLLLGIFFLSKQKIIKISDDILLKAFWSIIILVCVGASCVLFDVRLALFCRMNDVVFCLHLSSERDYEESSQFLL